MELLPMAQLTIDNKISVTTHKSPFKANHGMNANVGQMSKKPLQTIKKL